MPISGGDPSRDLAGVSLGRYLVQHRIGQGGMGTVYRATDTVLHRAVAIKVPHEPHAADPRARRAVLAEARAACRIQQRESAHVGRASADRAAGGRRFLAVRTASR